MITAFSARIAQANQEFVRAHGEALFQEDPQCAISSGEIAIGDADSHLNEGERDNAPIGLQ